MVRSRVVVVGALVAILLAGCEHRSPVAVSLVEPESTRWENVAGTPHAIATTWSNGAVNVAAPVHALGNRVNDYCLVRETVAWRGARMLNTFTGAVVTTSPLDSGIAVSGGGLELSLDGDTLRGLADVTFQSPCGGLRADVPLVLVRATPEVP